MNYFRYTFHRSFGYFLGTVTTLTAITLIVLFLVGDTTALYSIGLCYFLFIVTIMVGSYFRWQNYRSRYFLRYPEKINWSKLIRP
jgi:uncharacterized membrane protein YphA (DoxX/SURF4 family)